MAAFIVPGDGSGRILAFDVVESEEHESVSTVTDHPVESGVVVSDHVRAEPDRLSLVGLVTNQPITANPAPFPLVTKGVQRTVPLFVQRYVPPLEPTPGSVFRAASGLISGLFGAADSFSATVLDFATPIDPIRETYDALLELKAGAVLCQIVSGIKLYRDMILERVAAPRQAGRQAVSFSVDFRQIRIVGTAQVAIAPVPAIPSGAQSLNKGGQGTTTPGATDAAGSSSIAFSGLSAAGLL